MVMECIALSKSPQPQPSEPVAWMSELDGSFITDRDKQRNPAYYIHFIIPLYRSPQPSSGLTQLNDELELLGSMLRAERVTATVDNRKCTDEQLEIAHKVLDRLLSGKSDEGRRDDGVPGAEPPVPCSSPQASNYARIPSPKEPT